MANQLTLLNHSSAIIALNDKFITEPHSGFQEDDGIEIPVLRIPRNRPLNERVDLAKKYIDDFDPDWLSLQYVIFSFHPKGLPVGLNKQLKLLGKGRRWHIMFHELWVQPELQPTIKIYLWSIAQRQLIRSLITSLKPQVIHTNTRMYLEQIEEMGVKAIYLPLFSNIPCYYQPEGGHEAKAIDKGKSELKFIIFGHQHPGTPVKEFLGELLHFSRQSDIPVSIDVIGRSGSELENWVKQSEALNLPLHALGEQPTEEISRRIAQASIGISTTPARQIEKSGSVAAIHAHGLPVICVSAPGRQPVDEAIELFPGVSLYQQGNLETILKGKLTNPVPNTLESVAVKFINELEHAEVETGSL
ncbi:MAG TPA: hypothetical protein VGM63_10995, partial [Mucilaginibacter sp.]